MLNKKQKKHCNASKAVLYWLCDTSSILSALCVTFYRILKLEDSARACESVVSSKYLRWKRQYCQISVSLLSSVPFIHTKNNVCKTWPFCVEARGPWSPHTNRRQMLLSYDITFSLTLLTLCAISKPFHLCSNTLQLSYKQPLCGQPVFSELSSCNA